MKHFGTMESFYNFSLDSLSFILCFIYFSTNRVENTLNQNNVHFNISSELVSRANIPEGR
jgi:hypothetical protein